MNCMNKLTTEHSYLPWEKGLLWLGQFAFQQSCCSKTCPVATRKALISRHILLKHHFLSPDRRLGGCSGDLKNTWKVTKPTCCLPRMTSVEGGPVSLSTLRLSIAEHDLGLTIQAPTWAQTRRRWQGSRACSASSSTCYNAKQCATNSTVFVTDEAVRKPIGLRQRRASHCLAAAGLCGNEALYQHWPSPWEWAQDVHWRTSPLHTGQAHQAGWAEHKNCPP